MRRRMLCLAMLSLIMALASPMSVAAVVAESWDVQRVTDNDVFDGAPVISGVRTAWAGDGGQDGGDDSEIFTRTPTGGILQITVNLDSEHSVQVSGDRLVWCATGGADGGEDSEIFTWTPGEIIQLTENDDEDWYPQVSGDRIVWQGQAGVFYPEIFTWTPLDGSQRLTDDLLYDTNPQVDGDRIVWESSWAAWEFEDMEILTWTPDGIEAITCDDLRDEKPQVSEERVVWRGGYDANDPTADYEIMTWKPGEGIVQLTDNLDEEDAPRVSGDRVVWCDDAGVLSWVLGEGIERLSPDSTAFAWNPSVSGDTIGWVASDISGALPETREVWVWTPTWGTIPLTSNDVGDNDIAVDDGQLVWRQGQGSNSEIVVAAASALLDDVAPTISLRCPLDSSGYPVGEGAFDFSAIDVAGSGLLSVDAVLADGTTVEPGDALPAVTGIHTLTVTAIDYMGNVAVETAEFAVFDPSAGFVSGHGRFDSPMGAYRLDPLLEGEATFGFMSKYKKGATVPDGQAKFYFEAGDFEFVGSSQDWLVVSGSKARFKGTGAIVGRDGEFQYMVTAIDGDPYGNPDAIRFVIWGDAGVVYDNQYGVPSPDVTEISGGSIMVHIPR